MILLRKSIPQNYNLKAVLNSALEDSMRTISLPVILISIFSLNASGIELNCRDEISFKDSGKKFEAVNGTVKRLDEHTLEISHSKGKHIFADIPPHEPFEGTHYFYCGYNAELNLYLVEKDVIDTFSGILYSPKSGKVIEAGHTVSFSGDHKTYFSRSQINGMYNEIWELYSFDGEKIWNGESGFNKVVNGVEVSHVQLENPAWNSNNELTAHAVCPGAASFTLLTLVKVKGVFTWLPKLKCGL